MENRIGVQIVVEFKTGNGIYTHPQEVDEMENVKITNFVKMWSLCKLKVQSDPESKQTIPYISFVFFFKYP